MPSDGIRCIIWIWISIKAVADAAAFSLIKRSSIEWVLLYLERKKSQMFIFCDKNNDIFTFNIISVDGGFCNR